MRPRSVSRLMWLLVGTGVLAGVLPAQVPDKATVSARAEIAFEKAAKLNAAPAPGCAVGVSLAGETVFERAFGMAEMEHGIANTAQTIFESGSVAKQFTAAALVLLQQDGKLRIDDPVRKYIPELPDYGKPITIRHILTHTAGLRDWGSVMALTGAGRGDRVITQPIALDVIYRQKHLDFEPGAEYSYSNSGYQLAAEIVERVSGKKFGDFVSSRIFKPLGMTKSSWRDDYQKLVPGRAQAYSRSGTSGDWVLNMPMMNVIGNGGMLTTVGDWLKWNASLDAKTFGNAFVQELETQAVLNDNRKISYALGLQVGSYRGIKDVSHGGSTAGYQTFLARYPDRKVSIAVMCNGTSPRAGTIAASITDEIFGPFSAGAGQAAGGKVPADQLMRFVGIWKDEKTKIPYRMAFDKDEFRLSGVALRPAADGVYLLGDRRATFLSRADGSPERAEIANPDGSVTRLSLEQEWKPADLGEFVGDWYSEEAQSRVALLLDSGKLFLVLRPVTRFQLSPAYKDSFSGEDYVFWFSRDASGKVSRMHVGTGRMRDMIFERTTK